MLVFLNHTFISLLIYLFIYFKQTTHTDSYNFAKKVCFCLITSSYVKQRSIIYNPCYSSKLTV